MIEKLQINEVEISKKIRSVFQTSYKVEATFKRYRLSSVKKIS